LYQKSVAELIGEVRGYKNGRLIRMRGRQHLDFCDGGHEFSCCWTKGKPLIL